MTTEAMTAEAVKQGPMPTSGRWGWYSDHEGNEFRRVSKLVKYCETDTYNLDQWMKRQVAEGLAIRDDLVLAVKAMGRPDPVEGWSRADKDKLNSIAKDAMQAAKQADGARSGTAMHDLTERLDRGENVESVVKGLPARAAMSLRAYEFLRRANGWQNIAIERTVVCDELEAAGSFDRIDEIPGLTAMLGPGSCQYGDECPDVGLPGHGDCVVTDVKTETEPWLNGLHIGPQLAIYSRARRMWEALPGRVPLFYADGRPKMATDGVTQQTAQNGRYVPAPCARQDVGIVVHVLDGAAVPYFVNLLEGWEAAQAAYAQMKREQRAKRKLGAVGAWFVAMPGVKVPAPAQMISEQAVAARYADPGRPPDRAPTAEGERYGIPGDSMQWVAVRRSDGMVDWAPEPVSEPAIGTQVTVGGIGFTKVDSIENVAAHGVLDTIDRQAIENVWSAVQLSDLAETWRIYTEVCGRQWGGRVAEAADARRRQIECPQRALHRDGKCACGWAQGVPA